MKKILATILALVLAIGVTTMAWATETAAEKVAKVGETEYATLQEAVNAADGKTVQLLQDVTASITIESGKTVTLDLNGKTLTNEAGKHTITNYGDLTITSTGVVDNVSHACAALYNAPDALATLNGGTFDRSHEAGKNADDAGGNSYYTIKNFGEMVVNSGVTVQQDGTSIGGTKGKFSSLFANGWQSVSTAGQQGKEPAHTKDAVLTINGGTFIGGLNTVKNDDCGVMTINGGEFKNFAQACVQNHNELTITNGKFDGSELQAASRTVSVIYNCGCGADNDKGMLSISGGTFIGGKERTYVICDVSTVSEAYTDISGGTFTKGSATMIGKIDSAKVAVSGGTFTDAAGKAVDVSAYLVAGKQQNSDGSVGNKSYYYYYPSTSDTTTSTTTKGSPKTFDAGVGIYAVTAVLSVTGMAWTAKKRH